MDSGQYDSIQSNGHPQEGLSTAMSMDLPLIPDLPGAQTQLGAGAQTGATPFAHPGANVDAMGMPLIGGEYIIQQPHNSEVPLLVTSLCTLPGSFTQAWT